MAGEGLRGPDACNACGLLSAHGYSSIQEMQVNLMRRAVVGAVLGVLAAGCDPFRSFRDIGSMPIDARLWRSQGSLAISISRWRQT